MNLFTKIVVTLFGYLISCVWIYYTKEFYDKKIENVQKEKLDINKYGLLIMFITTSLGTNYFMNLGDKPNTISKVIEKGAMYGFITSSFMNSFNYTMLTNWDSEIALVDTSWGIIISIMSAVSYHMWL